MIAGCGTLLPTRSIASSARWMNGFLPWGSAGLCGASSPPPIASWFMTHLVSKEFDRNASTRTLHASRPTACVVRGPAVAPAMHRARTLTSPMEIRMSFPSLHASAQVEFDPAPSLARPPSAKLDAAAIAPAGAGALGVPVASEGDVPRQLG